MQFVQPAYNLLVACSFFFGLWFWDIREEKSRICPKCGATAMAKSKFCLKCGDKL